ncbi:ABC transporter ATP-binding protein [Candidatus Magnetobacterium bavaricum]|uniref:ABC transporter ATP-binding protein n=1 Tax=Candidatus Magnetobacterium bavaricum TaxID=29290 RepID=A0A0F3GYI5_9BACT|nr:ABC transporter ATP-binding protein [Candidatus Magnetobacterium bavaricum]
MNEKITSGVPYVSVGLSINHLTHVFKGTLILDELNCDFQKGSLIAVLGPSGCGKTTLLRCIAGLIRPTRGHVLLDGIAPSNARQQGVIGFAFQAPMLLPWRTALENVLLPLEIAKQSNPTTDKEINRNHAINLLSAVGLKEHADKMPRELSGGMKQRVSLARALITRPTFLFLDEPFNELDGISRNRLNVTVREICQTNALTTMMVTHSVEEAIFLADHIIILSSSPAKILHTLPIELDKKRDATTRMKDEFFGHMKQILRLIGEIK